MNFTFFSTRLFTVRLPGSEFAAGNCHLLAPVSSESALIACPAHRLTSPQNQGRGNVKSELGQSTLGERGDHCTVHTHRSRNGASTRTPLARGQCNRRRGLAYDANVCANEALERRVLQKALGLEDRWAGATGLPRRPLDALNSAVTEADRSEEQLLCW